MDAAARPAPQELLITLLGNELLHRPDGRVWAGGLVELLGRHGFSVQATRAACGRLVNRGLLTRERRGREADYALTPRAVGALHDGERRILSFADPAAEPDGGWLLLTYALASEHRSRRERLTRRLAFLGFGPVRDGVWLAAADRLADTTDLLTELGLTDEVELFNASPAGGTDIAGLVRAAWPDLDDLGRRYRSFARRWADDHHPDAVTARTCLMHEWRQFPLADPGLGDAHIAWAADRSAARDRFTTLWNDLAAPAADDFALTCRLESSGCTPTIAAGAHA